MLNIPFPSILNELQELTADHRERIMTLKALRVYRKCRRCNKNALAEAIAVKYKLNEISPLRSDQVMAFALSLKATENAKTKP